MENFKNSSLYSFNTQVGEITMFARTSTGLGPEMTFPTDRPVFVLIHGLLLSSRYMLPTAELLAVDYPVLVPDLPGFGQSGDPKHVMTLPELADELVKWMDKINLPRAIFLGNSLGCQVLTDLAVRYPARVDRLILTGPTLDPHARTLLQQFLRLLSDGPREPLSLSVPLVRDIFAGGPLRALETFRYALRDPICQKLKQIQAPTLVVRGSRDPISTQRWAEEAVALLPNGRLVVIPGAPHAVNYSAPDALVDVVCAFLKVDQ